MTVQEWLNLKHGDKVVFTNKRYPKRVGEIETVYVDCHGKQYFDSEGDSLFPLSQFDPDDWEPVPGSC